MKAIIFKTQILTVLLVFLTTRVVQASELTIPNQFSSGTSALASEVNGNFDAAAISVNDNQAQITAILARLETLEAENTDLTTRITELETSNSNLQAEIDSLNEVQVVGLSDYLTIDTDSQGNPTAVFSGVNLHVNNGNGNTNSRNALGNFIIGYDEINTDLTERCSRGAHITQEDCEGAGGIWSFSFKTGSHNLVVGAEHNYSNYGGVVAGLQNEIKGFYSNVLGGYSHSAIGNYSSISGGVNNITTGVYSHVSGGSGNEATASQSSVAGGRRNLATALGSHVSGGSNNEASGTYSVVSGGAEREASTTSSWVAGSLSENF